MAKMKHREPNMVNWVGTRPGHNGNQVFTYNHANGDAVVVIYTVPAGKTLFLTYMSLGSRESVAADGLAALLVYTGVPAIWNYLIPHKYDLAGQMTSVVALSFPIEIPAGYTVRVLSNHANIDATAVIAGWVEDA